MLSVQPNSPASDVIVFPSAEAARDGLRTPLHTALVSYLDFILSVNGEPLDEESDWFAEEIKQNVGQPVILEIYNVKWRKYRTVQVVPRVSNWGGDGFLGLHVRWDSMERAAECVLHVVDVAAGSPADEAGIVPTGDDFILGSAEGAFESVRAGGPVDAHECVVCCAAELSVRVESVGDPLSTFRVGTFYIFPRRLTYLAITWLSARGWTSTCLCCGSRRVRRAWAPKPNYYSMHALPQLVCCVIQFAACVVCVPMPTAFFGTLSAPCRHRARGRAALQRRRRGDDAGGGAPAPAAQSIQPRAQRV